MFEVSHWLFYGKAHFKWLCSMNKTENKFLFKKNLKFNLFTENESQLDDRTLLLNDKSTVHHRLLKKTSRANSTGCKQNKKESTKTLSYHLWIHSKVPLKLPCSWAEKLFNLICFYNQKYCASWSSGVSGQAWVFWPLVLTQAQVH